VVGCVGVVRDCSQVCKANNTADRDEETDEECRYDPNLLSPVPNLELHKLRDREEDDDEVKEYVEYAVGQGRYCKITAVTFVFTVPLVPEVADRLALEDEVDDKGHEVCDQCDNYSVGDVCES